MGVFWPRREFDIKFLPCARSPILLSLFGKMSTDFDGRDSSMWRSVLKYWSMSIANWLLRVIALALGFEAISDVLDTSSTHTHTRASHLAR